MACTTFVFIQSYSSFKAVFFLGQGTQQLRIRIYSDWPGGGRVCLTCSRAPSMWLRPTFRRKVSVNRAYVGSFGAPGLHGASSIPNSEKYLRRGRRSLRRKQEQEQKRRFLGSH